jgi:hypothetical protein
VPGGSELYSDFTLRRQAFFAQQAADGRLKPVRSDAHSNPRMIGTCPVSKLETSSVRGVTIAVPAEKYNADAVHCTSTRSVENEQAKKLVLPTHHEAEHITSRDLLIQYCLQEGLIDCDKGQKARELREMLQDYLQYKQ